MADSSRSLETLKSLAEAQSAITQARNKSIGAMQERDALLAKIDVLEEKLEASENWETEKQRYELQAAASGKFFYSLKADLQPNEPAQKLCAKCYQNGRKSVLQQMAAGPKTEQPAYGDTHQCPECAFEVVV